METIPEPYSDVRPYDHQLWSMPAEGSCEVEVTELLAALVRVMKPKTVVEAGGHVGFTAEAIGKALVANKRESWLITIEQNDHYRKLGMKRTAGLPVYWHPGKVEDLDWSDAKFCGKDLKIDLLWLDTDLDNRLAHFKIFEPYLSPWATVVVHDTFKRPKVREDLEAMCQPTDRGIELKTPRGLTIFQRPLTATLPIE